MQRGYMREEGIVIGASDGVAKVAMEPKPQCEHCGLCSRSDGGKRVVEASSLVSVSPGDKVVIEVSPRQIVRMSFVVYVFPLAALVGGVALGYFLSDTLGIPEKREILGLGLGIAGLLAAVLILKMYDRHIARTGTAQATILTVK